MQILPATFSLCEAVSDITSLLDLLIENNTIVIEDSREKVQLAIEWAHEFEDIHAGRVWGTTMPDGSYLDYSETIEKFTMEKAEKYRVPKKAAPPAQDSAFLSQKQLTTAVTQIANGFETVDRVFNDSFDPKLGRQSMTKRETCANWLNLPTDHILVDFFWAMHELRLGQSEAIQHRIRSDAR